MQRQATALRALVVAGGWLVLVTQPFAPATVAAVPGGPRIVVLPFAELGGNELSRLYSEAMTDELITALNRAYAARQPDDAKLPPEG